jgi:DNA-binding transcriptional LysR family regulator
MDLDLRKVRYFVAVADKLHFGRAAEVLHIAQPVLSRQIRALEEELHVQLFTRDRRRTELTPAGEQLLIDAGPLLASADATRRRVVRSSRGKDILTVGFMPGLVITQSIRALNVAHPDLTIDVVRTGWDDQVDTIRDGRVDVGVVRLPIDETGLKVVPLLCEPRVAVLDADHRLAGKEKIKIDDLADDHLLQDPDAVPEWRSVGREMRPGISRRPIPSIHTVEEKLEHVASGHGVVILPLSTAMFYRRPDVAIAAITDIGPNHVSLAWDASRRSKLISEYVNLAIENEQSFVQHTNYSRATHP